MTSSIVEVQNLEKYFVVRRPLHEQLFAPFAATQKIRALKGVSFSIKQGEILGVAGPNGAGKTTLLRILANLLEADAGWVKLCGQKLNSERCLRGKIGYVPSDERSFFWRLTGKQNLEFFGRLYGIPRAEIQRRIRKLLKVFALEEKAAQLFRDYSTGTRKKFALIRALAHQPKVVLLDELTNSLDVTSTQSVKSLVREYITSQSGCAGVWCTHRLEEIVEVCDKLLVIDKGLVSFFGLVSDLKNQSNAKAGDSKDRQPEDRSDSSRKYRFLLRAVELSITDI
jgi:ABC-2 type transport system ATP-binding protein